MARLTSRLKALTVSKLKTPGWYPDGAGLYLQVSNTLSKSWVYRYSMASVEHRIGLGSFPDVSLEAARERARGYRLLKSDGVDPLTHKRAQRTQKQLEAAQSLTFRECATSYIDAHKAGWRNAKHESQWRNTLETYAHPHIGSLPVQSVDVGLILKVLEPIWESKTETASRVRQRIENILDWAKARGYRAGENPAAWRGHLDKILPKPSKIQKVRHHPALHYDEVPKLISWLQAKDTLAAKALEFTILTATRSGESRGCTRKEVDHVKKCWTIPESRMKAGLEHKVPLSRQTMLVLNELAHRASGDYVFPGSGRNKIISETALRNLLAEYRPDLTVHGFRSSFRDWCAEKTHHPSELAEAALAHRLKDKTEAAYQRGDMFEKRARVMDEWGAYCISDLAHI